MQPARAIARSLADEISGALADGGRGERLREGLVVAIAGPPNAGKSTLLNRLARREAAIVSPYAGTTRDVIEVHLDLGGLPVTLLDTAGIRETEDPVEREGVRRTLERAAGADLVLWVVDASDAGPIIPGRAESTTAESSAAGFGADLLSPPDLWQVPLNGENIEPAPPAPPVWVIQNKIDLTKQSLNSSEQEAITQPKSEHILRFNISLTNIVNSGLMDKSELNIRTYDPLTDMVNKRLTIKTEQVFNISDLIFNLSAATGAGFAQLLGRLAQFAEEFLAGAESALVTRHRHRHALEEALAALRRALDVDLAEDLLAEELRLAARALERLTGRVDIEDILDVIFRDFCIGK